MFIVVFCNVFFIIFNMIVIIIFRLYARASIMWLSVRGLWKGCVRLIIINWQVWCWRQTCWSRIIQQLLLQGRCIMKVVVLWCMVRILVIRLSLFTPIWGDASARFIPIPGHQMRCQRLLEEKVTLSWACGARVRACCRFPGCVRGGVPRAAGGPAWQRLSSYSQPGGRSHPGPYRRPGCCP